MPLFGPARVTGQFEEPPRPIGCGPVASGSRVDPVPPSSRSRRGQRSVLDMAIVPDGRSRNDEPVVSGDHRVGGDHQIGRGRRGRRRDRRSRRRGPRTPTIAKQAFRRTRGLASDVRDLWPRPATGSVSPDACGAASASKWYQSSRPPGYSGASSSIVPPGTAADRPNRYSSRCADHTLVRLEPHL